MKDLLIGAGVGLPRGGALCAADQVS